MILITGGAGFIGSNLLAGLEARGETDLFVCDRLGTGDKWRNIAKREIAGIIEPGDLFEFLGRSRVYTKLDTIFHMGAISATTEKDADLIVRTNMTLSQRLFDFCAENGIRFIYASSAATYGDGEAGFVDEPSVEALAKLRPLNAYGWSKHIFDRRLARLIKDGAPLPPQTVGLKFFNVYGPNEFHKGSMRSVVTKLYPQLAKGEPARLFKSHHPDYEDGGQMRDFIWAGDCVDAMLWFFDNPKTAGLYNMGTGQARSFADLARAVFSAIGIDPKIDYFDTPEDLRDKYQYFTQADTTRLRAAGYTKEFTSLEDGVGAYVRDYLAKDDPYL